MNPKDEVTTVNKEFIPLYVDHKDLYKYTGLSRSYAYQLTAEGKFLSVSIRRPGSKKGKRLWHLPSVLAFLDSLREGTRQ